MLIIIAAVLASLCVLYALSTVGRIGHKGLAQLDSWVYAHRGLHGPGTPENSLKAFQAAKDAGYGVELDVHLLRDGNLVVMHDSQLQRCTGKNGCIEDLTTQELQSYHLEGTEETIPTFRSVLELYAGAAPIIVELKVHKNNYAALCEAACSMLDGYDGAYCLESFDPRCVFWLRRNRPKLTRGQLTENYLKNNASKLPWFLKFLLTNQMLNFLTLPDFVAYRFEDRKTFSNFLCRKLWHLRGVTWTVQNREEFHQAVKEGWIPIFENFLP